MNNINNVNTACTGCQMCAAICPFGAISIHLDKDGFYKPYTDNKACKNCGLCKKTCSKYDKDIVMTNDNNGVYAFKIIEKNKLKSVSSGGAAYALAQAAVKQGYLIAGTVYDCKLNVAKMVIDDDPLSFVGSKYIQSFVENTYMELLKNGNKKYIVFGTPCQIYSLNKALSQKNIRNNFILVDFFCHGCPSILLWHKYIDAYKQKNNSSKIENVEFRSKAHAWHEFCISINSNVQKDSYDFYDLFFSDALLNEACYNCKLRSTFYYADIRVGDFWGNAYDFDSEGVSALIAISELGQKIVDSLSKENFIAKHKLEDVTKSQAFNVVYSIDNSLRSRLLDALRTEKSIKDVTKIYYSSLSMNLNMKRVIKRIILKMPFSVRAFFRKMIH